MPNPAVMVPISVLYVFMFMERGIVSPYMPLWFKDQGMAAEAISLTLAMSAFGGLLVTPLIGVLATRWPNRNLVFVLTACVSMLCFGVMGIAAEARSHTLFCAGAFVLAAATVQALLPLLDVFALRASRESAPHYGFYRGLGTAGYVGANLIGGIVIARWNSRVVIPWCLITCASCAVVALVLPKAGRAQVQSIPVISRGSILWEVVSNPSLAAVLWVAGLIECSHSYFYGFSSLIWRAQGIGADWIGIIRAVCALAEVLFLFLAEPWCRRMGSWNVLLMASCASVIRWLAMAQPLPLWLIISLQILHAFSYTATFVAVLHFVDETQPVARQPLIQSLSASLISCFVPGVAILGCGYLYQRWQQAGYFLMAAFGFAALVSLLSLRTKINVGPLRHQQW